MDYLKIFNDINDTNNFLITHSSNLRKLVRIKSDFEVKEKTLFKFKIMTIDELINFLTFSEKDEVYLDMLKNGIKKNVSKEILKFAKYDFKRENKNLTKYFNDHKTSLDFHDDFFVNLNNYKFYSFEDTINLEPFIENFKLDFTKIEIKNNKIPNVYKFKTLEEEVVYLFNEIAKLIDNGISVNNIYISGINDNYYNTILKVARFFNISINLKSKEVLGEIPYVKKLLEKTYDEIFGLLTNINDLNEEFKDYRYKDKLSFDKNINKIINVFNKYPLSKYSNEVTYELIKEDIYNTVSFSKAITNSVNVINLEEIITTSINDYVFLINATYESFPKLVNDNEFLTDKEKILINYPDTTSINTSSNNHLEKLVKLEQIVYLSFPLRDKYNEYQASDLASKFKIVNKELTLDDLDKVYASNLIKDHFSDFDNLGELLTTFTGDFNLSKIEEEKMSNDLERDNFKLTPSSMARYFQVPFIYYLERVLKISNFKPQVNTLIGNFFHEMAEIVLLLEFEEKIKRNGPFQRDKNLNELVTSFIVKSSKDSLEEIFDNYLDLYINEIIKKESIVLKTETKFFIIKNKDLLINALDKLISLENFYNSKCISLEMSVSNKELSGNSDLVKVHPDDSFTIIDYKSNARKAFNYETISNAVDSLLNEENLKDLKDLDLLQLVIYGMLMKLEYPDLKLNNLGYFGYFTDDHRINALQTNDLDQTYYQGLNRTGRMINDEQEQSLYERLNLLIKKTKEKIISAKFPVSVLKQLDNKMNLEKEWFSTYQALAFFNRNSYNEEDEFNDEE